MYVFDIIQTYWRTRRFRDRVREGYELRRRKQTKAANAAWQTAQRAIARNMWIDELARKDLYAVRVLFFAAAHCHDPSARGDEWAREVWADYLRYRKQHGYK